MASFIKIRPVCVECGQFIYDDECYRASDYEFLCEECVRDNLKKMKRNCGFSFIETVEDMLSELKVDTDDYVKCEEVIA